MKKKLIALFAVCSMITTAVAGLVQTAYADGDPITIVVSDGATDTEKVVTLYYAFNDVACIEGNLTVNNGASITSGSITMTYASGMGDSTFNTADGYLFISSYGDGLTTADNSFATATITVPGDVDVTVTFTPINLYDGEFNDYGTDTVTATIPANAVVPPTPVEAVISAFQMQADDVKGEGIYDNQSAVVYAATITPNDDAVTGVKVEFPAYGKEGQLDFGSTLSGDGDVAFAVILVNESGVATLPSMDEAVVTLIK